MAGKITDLFVNIGAKTDDFKKGTQEITQQASKINSVIGKVGGVIAGAFATERLVSFAKEAVNLANAAEGIEMAFKRIGNKGILDDLRKETKGTVSDLELMKAAVQANNFNIPLEQLGKLLAFAHQRAKDTGQSVDYLVQSIVLGIGRKSPLILDNLGISAVALREKFKGLNAEQQSVGDIANAVGDIASESMKKIGDAALTSKDKLDQAKASTEDWQLRIGQFLKVVSDGFALFIGQLDQAITIQSKLLSNQNLSLWEKIGIIAKGNKKEIVEYDDALKRTAEIQAGELYNGYVKELQATKDLDKANQMIYDTYYSLIEQYGKMEDKKKINGKLNDQEYVSFLKIQKLLIDIGKLKNDKTDLVQKLVFGDPSSGGGSKEVIGIIEGLENKIANLKSQITKSTSETFAAKLTKELKDTENQLSKVKLQIDKLAFGEPIGTGLKPMQSINAKVSTNKTDFQLPGIDELDQFKTKYEEVGKIVVDVSQTIANGMADFVSSFAETIGEMAIGAASLGDVGRALLGVVAQFLGTLGKQLIAAGVAGLAFKFLASNPIAAIAAGTALVALSGVVAGTLSGGISGSHSVGSSSVSNYNNRNNELTIQIEGVLKGQDIYWSQKNFNKKYNNVGS